MQLRLGDKEYIGVNRSIKLAQRAAAQAAIDDQKLTTSCDKYNDNILERNGKNYFYKYFLLK